MSSHREDQDTASIRLAPQCPKNCLGMQERRKIGRQIPLSESCCLEGTAYGQAKIKEEMNRSIKIILPNIYFREVLFLLKEK